MLETESHKMGNLSEAPSDLRKLKTFDDSSSNIFKRSLPERKFKNYKATNLDNIIESDEELRDSIFESEPSIHEKTAKEKEFKLNILKYHTLMYNIGRKAIT
jgi:hypothetical protein